MTTDPTTEAPPLVLRTEISGPGVYDLPADVYHSDPAPAADGGSLSSSGARKILRPSTPAHFHWWRTHGQAPKDEFDFGHAAHRYVLSEGAAVETVDAPDWKKTDARDERDRIRAEGRIPLLHKDMCTVMAMVDALAGHRTARLLLDPAYGKPEQSLFWRHPRTGRWARARLDMLRHKGIGRRYAIPDYKTATDASREAFEKAAASYGYHQQDRFYRDAVIAQAIDPDPLFLFVVQEKRPPYLVNVIELDHDAHLLGDRLNDTAHNLFHQCLTTGRWPGYGDDIDVASLPPWTLKQNGL